MSELTPPDDGRFGDTTMHGDIIEPPTTKPAAPFNPFAVAQSEHISAGAVAIETGRGVAEVQGRMVLAKRFPRDSAMAYSRAMNACLRIGLAKEGIYKYSRGGTVEGPSIRLAEELARCWWNIEYGLNELARRPGESEMEAFAWDLETNVRSSQRFTVRHIRDRSEGGKALDTERDIYEITANMGARRMRSRILAILPPELIRDAVARCKLTVKEGGGEPLEDRIKKMMAAFSPLRVTPEMIAEHVGHPIDRITPDELVDLGGIYQSLKDNQSKVKDWFGPKTKETPADADPFEAASSGKAADAPKSDPAKPDPDLTHANDIAAQFMRCATPAEIEALAKNPKVAGDMKRWKAERPDCWEAVDGAAGARKAELRGCPMTPTQPPAREAEETPEAQLTELHLDERGLEFRMKHPIVPLMAEHLAEAFKDAGGVNYVAFDVNCEDIGPLVLIMQRRLGETPEMQVRRLRATLATTQAERDALAAELADLQCSVIAFGAPAMHQWAQDHGLPRGHLHPEHYDILARAGARMDDFTRAEMGE